jgi:hypothetical protein
MQRTRPYEAAPGPGWRRRAEPEGRHAAPPTPQALADFAIVDRLVVSFGASEGAMASDTGPIQPASPVRPFLPEALLDDEQVYTSGWASGLTTEDPTQTYDLQAVPA